MPTHPAVALSARESEVLEALGEHLTNAQIGRRLHISVRTVESHVSSLLRKLDAADRRDLAVRADALALTPSARARRHPVAAVPRPWTSFVGRGAELADITGALDRDRLVTLVGPGGIGKTRLAIAAVDAMADRFPGGGAFVDLVPVGPDLVVQAVAAALDVVERPRGSLEAVIHERLSAGPALLVLDNCEHVLAAAATLVRGVLAACPAATVLATSRERLGIIGERVVPVSGLRLAATPDAAGEAERLFAERAAHDSSSPSDPALVAEICRRLEGIPLAIELTAARTASLGLDGLLAGLDDSLRLLGATTGPERRHRSLRAVLDWSHGLLGGDERHLFRRLAVFTAAFDIDAAAEVAADGDRAAASDVVGRLADKSLLERVQDGSSSRWRMLETVHAYAGEKLDASGERPLIDGRHFEWARATAARLEQALEDGTEWQRTFDVVVDDLRAGLCVGRCVPDRRPDAYELARALAHLFYARRWVAEAREHFDRAVELAPDELEAVEALRVAAAGAAAEMRGGRAYDLLLEASRRAEAAGDRAVAALTLADAAGIAGRMPATFRIQPPRAALVGAIRRARALAAPGDPDVDLAVAIGAAWNSGVGPTEADPAVAAEALRLARRIGDPARISNALDAVGAAALTEGRFRDFAASTDERVALLDRLPRHDPRAGAEVHDIFHMAVESALSVGDLAGALGAAHALRRDVIGRGLTHFAACHMVVPLALRGSFDDAIANAVEAEDGWTRSGRPAAGWMAPGFFAAALVQGLRGDDDERARWWEIGGDIRLKAATNSFSHYAEMRLALHAGDLDRAAAAGRTERACAGYYDGYADALQVEVAVVAGDADAAARLDKARASAEENDFAAAYLWRAAGRLHEDDAAMEEALRRWERLDARFERACTLMLLPERAEEGRQELAALGCALPGA